MLNSQERKPLGVMGGCVFEPQRGDGAYAARSIPHIAFLPFDPMPSEQLSELVLK
jgi:hypothetical protein